MTEAQGTDLLNLLQAIACACWMAIGILLYMSYKMRS